MTEKDIQKKIIRHLKNTGWFVRKLHQGKYSGAGMPDIHALKDGIPIYVEVKRPGKKPTKLQAAILEDLEMHGGKVTWTTSLENFKEWLKNILTD